MTIQDKFDKILKTNKLKIKSIFGLERYSKVGIGSVSKFLSKGESPTIGTIKTIQEALSINTEWWETGKGDIYLEKPTQMPKPNDNDGNLDPEEDRVLRELIERNDKYRLVPTIILTEYEILSKNEIASRESLLQELIASQRVVIASKNDVITELKKEIDLLKSGQIFIPTKQT